MSQVTIFHNLTYDAFSGFDSVDGPHYLVKVFAFDSAKLSVPADSYPAILGHIFEEFNVGTTPLAEKYRTRRLRSFSVGDVVDVDGHAWSCESTGWKARKGRDLVVLDGIAADDQIRARFDFRPDEELSITVPFTN